MPDFEKMAREYLKRGPVSYDNLAEWLREAYQDGVDVGYEDGYGFGYSDGYGEGKDAPY